MRGVSVAPLAERLDALMIPEPNTGCHLWLGHIKDNGYGTLGVKDEETGKWYTEHAHIASYETFVGPVPPGHDLDHKCRLRCCINYDHLEPVTRSVNLTRSPLMNRQRHKERCPKGHPYSGTNNRGQRICHICLAAAHARSRRKNHA